MAFSFIQITDHHLGESAQDQPFGYPASATFQAVMDNITYSNEDFDFLVSTGDLVNRPTDDSYRYLKTILNMQPARQVPGPHFIRYGRLWDFPVYLLPGNHDDRTTFFNNLYDDEKPEFLNANFQHKGVNFICLDWGGLDRGEISNGMLSFLESALDDGLPAVLLMHHNVIPLGVPWLDRFIANDIDRFYKCLEGRNVLGILCGHLHTTYETHLDGIPVLGLRSTGFQFRVEGKLVMSLMPLHYRIVTIDDHFHLTSRIIEVPLPAGL